MYKFIFNKEYRSNKFGYQLQRRGLNNKSPEISSLIEKTDSGYMFFIVDEEQGGTYYDGCTKLLSEARNQLNLWLTQYLEEKYKKPN